MSGPSVVAVGGGHGLSVTLRACVPWAGQLTAIVSVADDGGSSGRIRSATGLPAPGDLRRCLTSLADASRAVVAAALERRFEGGDLDGHPAGNVLLAALAAECGGDLCAAAAHAAELLGVPGHVRVVPSSTSALALVATTVDGARVDGQVAVEASGRVDRVRVEPAGAEPPQEALDALEDADLVVLGPGSLYGSVLAAAVVPGVADALAAAKGRSVFVCNLRPRPPETAGYTVADHVEALHRHGIHPDVVLADPAALARPDGAAHDPERLGAALRGLL